MLSATEVAVIVTVVSTVTSFTTITVPSETATTLLSVDQITAVLAEPVTVASRFMVPPYLTDVGPEMATLTV